MKVVAAEGLIANKFQQDVGRQQKALPLARYDCQPWVQIGTSHAPHSAKVLGSGVACTCMEAGGRLQVHCKAAQLAVRAEPRRHLHGPEQLPLHLVKVPTRAQTLGDGSHGDVPLGQRAIQCFGEQALAVCEH